MDKTKIHTMALIGIMAALICAAAPISLPVGPVPISLGTLALYFSALILGAKKSFMALVVYVLIGAVGLPVFSGFSGGIGKLFGPTGGYILGYFFMVPIIGLTADIFGEKRIILFLGAVLGTIVLYFFGTVWLIYSAQMDPAAAVAEGVLLFLPGDFIKIILAVVFAPIIKNRLRTAELL